MISTLKKQACAIIMKTFETSKKQTGCDKMAHEDENNETYNRLRRKYFKEQKMQQQIHQRVVKQQRQITSGQFEYSNVADVIDSSL